MCDFVKKKVFGFFLSLGFVRECRHVVEVGRRPQVRHPGCEPVCHAGGRCHGESRRRPGRLEAGDAGSRAAPAPVRPIWVSAVS